MSHNDTILRHFDNAFRDFIKLGSTLKHGIIDPGKFYHKRLDRLFGIYQAYKLVDNFVTIEFIDGNFSNSFLVKLASGCFYVEYCVQKMLKV